jgi:hypothetical protein
MHKLILIRPNQKTVPKTLNLKGVLNNYTKRWRNRQTERQTDRHTDRWTHAQTDRDAGRKRKRQTGKQMEGQGDGRTSRWTGKQMERQTYVPIFQNCYAVAQKAREFNQARHLYPRLTYRVRYNNSDHFPFGHVSAQTGRKMDELKDK